MPTKNILPDGLDALEAEFRLAEVMRLIERTARWVDPETFRLMPVWFPESARRLPFYKANWSEPLTNTNRKSGTAENKLETNESASRALTMALGIPAGGRPNWSCCHIWGIDDASFQNSNAVVQDPRFYSCVANMVLLPTPLKAFTDAMPTVKAMLRHCAANLYDWTCDHVELGETIHPDDRWQHWPAYPASWPRKRGDAMPPGVMGLTDNVRSAAEQRLKRLRRDVENAGPKYPRRQVKAALLYWRDAIGCRSYDPILRVVHASELPDPTAPEDVFAFAMTFNGYDGLGTFEASAEAARQRRRESLDDLRNELFFAARASRHCGDEEYLRVYAELLPLLRQHALEEPQPAGLRDGRTDQD